MCFLLLGAGGAATGSGGGTVEVASISAAEAVAVGQSTNVFLQLTARQPVTGVRVEMPAGWRLSDVFAVRDGGASSQNQSVQQVLGIHRVSFDEALRGSVTVVLTIDAPSSPGTGVIRVAPVVNQSTAPEWTTVSIRADERIGPPNPAFRLHAENEEPVQIRRRALPSLSPEDALTIEFWLKTIGLDEVVLSTWDGETSRPYPLEMMVDARGRLLAYRGRPGFHAAVASPGPVADGTWRHIAFVRDPDHGWARLYIDGAVVDSMLLGDGAYNNTLPLALGGRPLPAGPREQRLFSGTIDEMRIWPTARGSGAIRRMMRLTLPSPPAGIFRSGFDEPFSENALTGPRSDDYIVAADLVFGDPVDRFEAEPLDGQVRLSWASRSRSAHEFVLERSRDGRYFEALTIIPASASTGEIVAGQRLYEWLDSPPAGSVAFYRLREVDRDGDPRTVATLKVGLGSLAPDEVLAIRGNSPNPFRDRTTLKLEIPRPGHATVSVWDISGSHLATVFEGDLAAGRHSLNFVADGLPAGVYFVRVETAYGTAAHRMTLTR